MTKAKRVVLLKAYLIDEASGVVEVFAKKAAIIAELIFDKMVRALRGGDSAGTAIYAPAIGVVDGVISCYR